METSVKRLSMECDPPFLEAYKTLMTKTIKEQESNKNNNNEFGFVVVEEVDLPLIDVGRLELGAEERQECMNKIAKAASEWGFFQVVNHGISRDIMEKMLSEQMKVFKQPFELKIKEDKNFNLSAGSYRWGNPSAIKLSQFSWSEAFHIPMTSIFAHNGVTNTLSLTIKEYATKVSELARKLVGILAERRGHELNLMKEHCLASSCYFRMNRCPPCPISSEVYALLSHTDSDFLTILQQDQVGGLQIMKDEKWIAVKPNPNALVINIGDLFQAWSNNVYKSIQHRVVANPHVERFSMAYFVCPSDDTVIRGCNEPSVYREFSFGEYRNKVQEDLQNVGIKIGLSRFLA